MNVRVKALSWLTVTMLSGGLAAAADDPCTASKWNLTQEHALFSHTAQSAAAGRDVASAPAGRPRYHVSRTTNA